MSAPGASNLEELKQRPRTHKPRGICRYYDTPRGCFAGDKCKFLHGQDEQSETSRNSGERPLLTPYDQAKTCRYFENGFCRRGDSCWFKHNHDSKGKSKAEEDDSELLCAICYEYPVTFGLLAECNHVFCLKCIKSWRGPAAKAPDMLSSSNTKTCPMCRTQSHFITPSSIFVEHGTEEKTLVIQNYKDSMGRVPCKYFLRTRSSPTPLCPFGKDCFYKHEKADGTAHVFSEGADVWMRRYAARHTLRRRNMFGYESDSDDDFEDFFPFNLDVNSLSLFDLLPTVMPPQPSAAGSTEAPATTSVGASPSGDVRVLADGLTNTLSGVGGALDAVRVAFETFQRIRYEARQAGGDVAAGDRAEDEAQERMEILASQMLSSVNVLRNGGYMPPRPAQPASPPRPTESTTAAGNDSEPLPPLETITDGDNAQDIYETMPDLDSVSDASEDDIYSDFSEGNDDSGGGSDEEAEVQQMIMDVLSMSSPFDEPRSVTESLGHGWPLLGYIGRHDPPRTLSEAGDEDADETAEPASTTSSTGRSTEDDSEAPQPPPVSSPEPPFVTDGRGRVVWTSNASQEQSQGPSRVPAQASALRLSADVVAEPRSAANGGEPSLQRSKVLNGPGFTTDGRGRVVGTGSLVSFSQGGTLGEVASQGQTAFRGLYGGGPLGFLGNMRADLEGHDHGHLELDEVD